MKTFTQKLNEACVTADKQPGNSLASTGISNHYTPIENILTNIRNIFCPVLGVVASVGEDNVSIKLHCMKFINNESINDVLYNPVDRYTSLAGYITSQGLTKITKVNLGMYYVVYFSPEDINTAKDPETMEPNAIPTPKEVKESNLSEFEITPIIKEDDGEEELKSQTVEKVLELLDGPDKVKAAKQLEILIANEISLPREYYFSAIKFKSGEEAIALRWKYTKNMPFGKSEKDGEYKEISVENVRSIMHIFGKGEMGIWVQDFAEDSLVQLPDEVKKLIESILDILDAGKTKDPSVFSLTGERKERDEDDKDKDEDKDKEDKDKEDKDKEDKDENKDKNENDDDSESDDDRGDSSDDLLK